MNKFLSRILACSLLACAAISCSDNEPDDNGMTYPDNPQWIEFENGYAIVCIADGNMQLFRHNGDDSAFAYLINSMPDNVDAYTYSDGDVVKISGRYKELYTKTIIDAISYTTYFTIELTAIELSDIASSSNLLWGTLTTIEEEPVENADESGLEMKYRVAKLVIDTSGKSITSKEEYIGCSISIDADGTDWDYETNDAQIRGRGNSSWEWYDKKPYRIKLGKKAPLMGMGEGKSWVLLANYRDPTDLMNTFVFELGERAGLAYTNHTRYAEVTLNGKDIGLYQLTEQVQQGKGRVNIDEDGGYLISLDRDDGPELSPSATDNFWSSVYQMPICVKNPDSPTSDVLATVKSDLSKLESAIRSGDYDLIKSLLDVASMIDYIMIQEIVYNVELDAPRSMFMYKDTGGDIWHMGPLWDFDAGYDFDWSNMYTGHRYFTDFRELVLGTSPSTHAGTIYAVPGFFSDLFKIHDFVSDYKNRWKEMRILVTEAWNAARLYVDADAWSREQSTWPVGLSYSNEINRMNNWINNRIVYLDSVISNY